MEEEKGNPRRIFVKVRADHEIGGKVHPLCFKAEEQDVVRIDRVLDVRRAPSLKAGGQGIRYTCRTGDREIYLFHDRDDWFIEPGG